MQYLYNFLLIIIHKLLPISKLFSAKMRLFVNGRRQTFNEIQKKISKNDKVIWLHAASLGEYEQGVPILEVLKKDYPNYKLLVTFFSPSGYEVKKNNPLADCTTYLPLDTPQAAKRFVTLAHPQLALFVKYEIWPNYLKELTKQHTPTLLVSGNFRKEQIYFKPYGRFMRQALQRFQHLFVQTAQARDLLKQQGFKNVSISGDTRFDRVANQLNIDNHLDFVEEFKGKSLCVVCGSTWPEDEALLLDYINSAPKQVKFIIAPHQIKQQKIEEFRSKLTKSALLYSERAGQSLVDCSILIVNTVGLLSKIYAYADLAYVGGAAGTTGLHNILEPATFGVPIIIGQNHQKFPEAQQLIDLNAVFSVKTPSECSASLKHLVEDDQFRIHTGQLAKDYINSHRGATACIIGYIKANKLIK